jgi:hypothetical protein
MGSNLGGNTSAGGATSSSATKTAANRYHNNSMLQEQSEDQLDKLCLNDVSLTKGGADLMSGGSTKLQSTTTGKKPAPSGNQKVMKIQSKTMSA